MGRNYRIGQLAAELGLGIDTLRYYEKLGLLCDVSRDTGGRRIYTQQDYTRLRFIQRAKAMGFTLAEIAELLRLRTAPLEAKEEIQSLTRHKLAEIEARIEMLETLRNELHELLDECQQKTSCCPIMAKMDDVGDR